MFFSVCGNSIDEIPVSWKALDSMVSRFEGSTTLMMPHLQLNCEPGIVVLITPDMSMSMRLLMDVMVAQSSLFSSPETTSLLISCR